MKRKQAGIVWWIALAVVVVLNIGAQLARTATAQTRYSPAAQLQTGDITGTMIRDGTITNADVSSTAAIAASKIAATSSAQFVTSGTQSFAGTKTFTAIPTIPTSTPTSSAAIASKGYADAAAGTPNFTAYASGTIQKGQAVFLLNDLENTSSVDQTTNFIFGGTSVSAVNARKVAQCFTPAATSTPTSVTFFYHQEGTPTDDAIISIQLAPACVPNGTMLTSSTIAVGSLVNDAANTWTFNVATSVNAGTMYALVGERSGSLDDANKYNLRSFIPNLCASCKTAFYNGTNWTTQAPTSKSTWFRITVTTPYYAVAPASAATSTTALPFVGFADATIPTNTSGKIDVGGVAPSASSTYPGGTFYLADAYGSVSSTPGTFVRKVGIGASSSSILITNTW